MEFIKTAATLLTDEAGDVIREPVRDEQGNLVIDEWSGEVLTRAVEDPAGAVVLQTTEVFADVDARHLATALKQVSGRVEKIEHVAGGPIVIRIRKEPA